MVDLSSIVYNEKRVEILHPGTKEPLGVTVTLMAPDDKRLDKTRDAITDQVLALQAKNKNLKADQVKHNRNMILFRAMVGWEWVDGVEWNGEKLDFNQKNVVMLLNELPWFLKQVDEAFSELEGFFDSGNSI